MTTARPLLLATLAVLAFAGCGGSGGGAGDGSDDTPPPSAGPVRLVAPAALARDLTGSLRLAAEVEAGSSVAAVEFELDGELVGRDDTAPYEITVDTTAYASGPHGLRVRGVDATGGGSDWAATRLSFGGDRRTGAGFALDDDWVDGLDRATAMAQAPDGRWFVAEQGGRVRIVREGALLPTPFVQLAAVDSQGERGLIGIALHPQFASNGWVYLHHTSTEGGVHNRVVRVVAEGDRAAAGDPLLILRLPALSGRTNHNGGAIHFAPDGTLFIGVGENASRDRAQDLDDPFGKLLRIRDDGSIPADNPYAASRSGLARAIWASGLRNPFTFAIEPSSGRLHVNDVGEQTWEEINLGAPGANYGWPASEGPDGARAGDSAPLFAYGHSPASPPGSGPGGFFTGQSIAGGAFYPAAGSFPASHRGQYYFADFVSRFVARLDESRGEAYAFATLDDAPVDLRVGGDGALYALTRGGISRVVAVLP